MANLYSNLLQDPTIQFADSSDQAQRLAQFQKLMASASPGSQGAAQGLPKAPPQSPAMSPFGLPAAPFAPGAGGRRRNQPPPLPPPAEMPPMPDQKAPADNLKEGLQSVDDWLHPKGKDTAVADAIARADARLRGLPQLPDTAANDQGKWLSPASSKMYGRAMTPLEGPDTGEINPNADAAGEGYYARLRKPEGTEKNYDARNPTTDAAGPYQFMKGTWQSYMNSRPELGLTMEGYYKPSEHKDQHEAAIHAYTGDSMKRLVPHLGRLPTPGELYALHLLGHEGGMKLLKNLGSKTSEVIPQAVFGSNPWMHEFEDRNGYRLVGQFEKMMGGSNS